MEDIMETSVQDGCLFYYLVVTMWLKKPKPRFSYFDCPEYYASITFVGAKK